MDMVKTNLFYMNLIAICRNGLFFQPILFVYFESKGIAAEQVLLSLSIMNLALVFMEIPAGYISDLVSRKKILIFASFLFLLCFVNFYILESFAGLILSNIFMAIGVSFYSGLIASIIYDNLLSVGRESENKLVAGKINANSAYMAGFASLIGGILYVWHPDAPILINCAIFIVALLMVFKIKDVDIKRDKINKSDGKKAYLKQLGGYLKYITIEHPELRWIIGLAVVMNVATALNLQLLQPLWKAHSIPIWMFGILMLFAQVGGALGMANAHKISIRFGERNVMLLLWGLLVLCYFIMGSVSNFIAVGLSLIPPIVMGVGMTISTDMINQRVEGRMRVTMASVNATAFRIFAAVFLQLSALAFAYNFIGQFYVVIGFVIFAIGGYVLYKMTKKNIFT